MTGQQMKQSRMLRIFASYYKPHWKLFALDMVCALVICVMLTIRWELALIVFTVIPLFVAFTAIQRQAHGGGVPGSVHEPSSATVPA